MIEIVVENDVATAVANSVEESLRSMVEGGTFEERPDEFTNLARGYADLKEAIS